LRKGRLSSFLGRKPMADHHDKKKRRAPSGKSGAPRRSEGKGSGRSGSKPTGKGKGYNGKPGRSSGGYQANKTGRSGGSSRGATGDDRYGKTGHTGGSSRGATGDDRYGDDRGDPKRRRDLKGAAVDLPNWIVEALVRVTPKDRRAPALEALGEASAAMRDGRYHAAVKDARHAKSLSPNDTTIRETLGLAAYRIGDWDTALSELRAYRRMAGDASHLPIEMDVLRAKGRDRDVEAAWELLQKSDVRPAVYKEGKVVYASFLLDKGDAAAAWDLTGPDRVGPNAKEADLRVWYIAARAAAINGDTDTARRIADAIVLNDPSFAGLDELDRQIARNL